MAVKEKTLHTNSQNQESVAHLGNGTVPTQRSEEPVEFALWFHLHVDSKVRIQAQAPGLLCREQLCPPSQLTSLPPHTHTHF